MIADDQDQALLLLVRDLQDLGFNDYEARAYIALLKLQPATAYEVSKEANIPKANSYTVLESLSRKEAVQPVSEQPVKYMAVAPETLFGTIAERTQRRCDRVKDGLARIAEVPSHEYVWSVTGADAVTERIIHMIRSARDHLWIKASDASLEPYRALLAEASGRGIEILIILFGTDAPRFDFGGRSKVWLHEGNGVPVGNSPFLITMTRDFEEALLAETRDRAYGSYTRSRPLVTMADTLIRHEIYFAEIFAEMGDDIQKRFGPALVELRRKYLPKEQVAILERRLEADPPADQPVRRRRASKATAAE
ncbi:TrmB family transcriptional regulator [Mongoliimonas terrestris]|uniref:TrmB family transcriptional regulator n=1 Tax=Mongoliimonas terrestris TaxID=1709001 RepID=UPI00094980F9|nr:TrmB family transcriptional regulator [Mongoliimonas terrestris]